MQGPEVSDDELREVTPEVAALIPALTARRIRALPLGFTADDPPRLRVAMRDPEDSRAVAEVRAAAGYPIAPVRAWNVQLSLALDRIYPAVQLTSPAPVAKPGADWKKIKVEGVEEEESLLHDGDNTLGRIAMYALGVGVVIVAMMFVRYWLKHERHHTGGPSTGWEGEWVEGKQTSAPADVTIDFGEYTWLRYKRDANSELFVKLYGDTGVGYLRFWRSPGVAPATTSGLIEALKADGWGPDPDMRNCEASELHDAPAVECHAIGEDYWAWVVDGDLIGVRFDQHYVGDFDDELIDIVATVQAR